MTMGTNETKFLPIFIACLAMAPFTLTCAQKQEYLDAHNAARAILAEPPLVWDDVLEKYALNHTKKRLKDCELVHSYGPYGENLAKASWDMSPTEAVDMWVDEKKLYSVVKNSCVGGGMCGHYTQVVWRTTERVGCAKASCRNGWSFVTCSYDPPGNYIGERPF